MSHSAPFPGPSRRLPALALPALLLLSACSGNPEAAPTIASKTVERTLVAGTPGGITLVAVGKPDPTYLWERSSDGVTWAVIPGAHDATLTLLPRDEDHGTRFRGTASNSRGYVTGPEVTLSVIVPATFQTHPRARTSRLGEGAAFTAKASEPVRGTLSYQWEFSLDAGEHWAPVPGARTGSLSLDKVALAQAGDYRAVALVTLNRTTARTPSQVAHLTVQAP